MKKAFIIHGTHGHPGENWFPWLKEELEKLGLDVIVPHFPLPGDNGLQKWFGVFQEYVNELDEETILIGHSLGCSFILNVLEKYDKKVDTCFLVAGFTGNLDIKEIDELNYTLTEKEFNWNKIRSNCKKFILYQSTDDPYVLEEKAIELRNNLDAELVTIENAGHFNTKSGYTEFRELLEKIKNI